jgi:capsular exopolysaccharide synthesis family protein
MDVTENAGVKVIKFFREKSLPINEAVSKLAVKVHEYKHRYGKKSILFTGCGASDGATVISLNLAMALAGAGRRTLYIDADLRTWQKHENRMLDSGLYDMLRGRMGFDETVCRTNVDGMDFLPSGKCPTDPALLFCSGQTGELFSLISGGYDFVIIDCPSVTAVPDASALFMSVDGIILVCTLDKTTKKQLKSAKSAVEPYSDKYYGLVVNSVDIKQYKNLFPDYGYYLKAIRYSRKPGGKAERDV